MQSKPRYFVIQADHFDAVTLLNPTLLNPKAPNGFGSTPVQTVPTQNTPRLWAAISEGAVGRFSWRSLLRGPGALGTEPDGGNIAALVRVRCITPPTVGDYIEQRSANISEQVNPPGLDLALAPQIPLTQQWSRPIVLDPTDALVVRHTNSQQGAAQITIEVAEFSDELYAIWVGQQGCGCDCNDGEIQCCGEETRLIAIADEDIGGVQLEPSAFSLSVNVTSEIPNGLLLLPLVGNTVPGARVFVRREPGSSWFTVASPSGVNGIVAPDGIILDTDGEGVLFELTNGEGWTASKEHRDLEPVPVTTTIGTFSGVAVRVIRATVAGNLRLPAAGTVAQQQLLVVTKDVDAGGNNFEVALLPSAGETIDGEVNKQIILTNISDTVFLIRDDASPTPGWRSVTNLFGRANRLIDTPDVAAYVIPQGVRGVRTYRATRDPQVITLPLVAATPIGYAARIFSTHANGVQVQAGDGTLVGLGASGAVVTQAQYVVRQYMYEGEGIWTVT